MQDHVYFSCAGTDTNTNNETSENEDGHGDSNGGEVEAAATTASNSETGGTHRGGVFVQHFFDVLFTMILDSERSKAGFVGNMRALKLLVRIIERSASASALPSAYPELYSSYCVLSAAVQCIKDVLYINPLNVVAVNHAGGIKALSSLMSPSLLVCDKDGVDQEASADATGASDKSLEDRGEFALVLWNDLVREVDQCLRFVAVTLSKYDHGIVIMYSQA